MMAKLQQASETRTFRLDSGRQCSGSGGGSAQGSFKGLRQAHTGVKTF